MYVQYILIYIPLLNIFQMIWNIINNQSIEFAFNLHKTQTNLAASTKLGELDRLGRSCLEFWSFD